MYIKSKIYNLIILSIYLATCFLIFNQTEEEKINTKIKVKDNIPVVDKEVIGSIEIDKINLKKPLYKIESEKNNVEKNVTILKESILPDQEESILFIAAHSGDSKISFFDDLDKLEKNDKVEITYQNQKYTYQISSIWEEEKNGHIHVNKESKKQLILTTCSPKHKDKQLVMSGTII